MSYESRQKEIAREILKGKFSARKISRKRIDRSEYNRPAILEEAGTGEDFNISLNDPIQGDVTLTTPKGRLMISGPTGESPRQWAERVLARPFK